MKLCSNEQHKSRDVFHEVTWPGSPAHLRLLALFVWSSSPAHRQTVVHVFPPEQGWAETPAAVCPSAFSLSPFWSEAVAEHRSFWRSQLRRLQRPRAAQPALQRPWPLFLTCLENYQKIQWHLSKVTMFKNTDSSALPARCVMKVENVCSHSWRWRWDVCVAPPALLYQTSNISNRGPKSIADNIVHTLICRCV